MNSFEGQWEPIDWSCFPCVGKADQRLLQQLLSRCGNFLSETNEIMTLDRGRVIPWNQTQWDKLVGESTNMVFRIYRDSDTYGFVVVSGAIAAACTYALFNHDVQEIPAIRHATSAERAVVTMLISQWVVNTLGHDVRISFESTHEHDRSIDTTDTLWVESSVVTHGIHAVLVMAVSVCAVTKIACRQPMTLDNQWEQAGYRMDGDKITADVVFGRSLVALNDVRSLVAGDIVVFDQWVAEDEGHLILGEGIVELKCHDHQITVCSRYQRVNTHKGITMDSKLAEDMNVEMVCRLGQVSLSVHDALSLKKGDVFSMEKPVEGLVDVVIGGRLIGQGELVNIEGEMGVRLLELFSDPTV